MPPPSSSFWKITIRSNTKNKELFSFVEKQTLSNLLDPIKSRINENGYWDEVDDEIKKVGVKGGTGAIISSNIRQISMKPHVSDKVDNLKKIIIIEKAGIKDLIDEEKEDVLEVQEDYEIEGSNSTSEKIECEKGYLIEILNPENDREVMDTITAEVSKREDIRGIILARANVDDGFKGLLERSLKAVGLPEDIEKILSSNIVHLCGKTNQSKKVEKLRKILRITKRGHPEQEMKNEEKETVKTIEEEINEIVSQLPHEYRSHDEPPIMEEDEKKSSQKMTTYKVEILNPENGIVEETISAEVHNQKEILNMILERAMDEDFKKKLENYLRLAGLDKNVNKILPSNILHLCGKLDPSGKIEKLRKVFRITRDVPELEDEEKEITNNVASNETLKLQEKKTRDNTDRDNTETAYLFIEEGETAEDGRMKVKIGKTKGDVEKRGRSLNTGNWRRLVLIGATKRYTEDQLHSRFEKYRIKRGGGSEWFDLPIRELTKLMEEIENEDDTSSDEEDNIQNEEFFKKCNYSYGKYYPFNDIWEEYSKHCEYREYKPMRKEGFKKQLVEIAETITHNNESFYGISLDIPGFNTDSFELRKSEDGLTLQLYNGFNDISKYNVEYIMKNAPEHYKLLDNLIKRYFKLTFDKEDMIDDQCIIDLLEYDERWEKKGLIILDLPEFYSFYIFKKSKYKFQPFSRDVGDRTMGIRFKHREDIETITITEDDIEKFSNSYKGFILHRDGFSTKKSGISHGKFELENIQRIINFLSENYYKVDRRKYHNLIMHASYGFKHQVGYLMGKYVANGDVILACIILGVEISNPIEDWFNVDIYIHIKKYWFTYPFR